MSPDSLKPQHHALRTAGVSSKDAVHAVLEVLAGARLYDAATRVGIEPADLATAVEIYQHAGQRALEEQTFTEDWWQVYIHFSDWRAAEKTAAGHLAPLLHRAESNGAVSAWWFIRKHPCWRLRLRIPPHSADPKENLVAGLNELAADGHVRRWWTGIYESETAAFGNAIGMKFAHELFHADSRAILNLHYRAGSPLGRRELSILLCSTLLRAAGLEWYEQGDVWHLVAQQRPLPDDVSPHRLQELGRDLTKLMLADTAADGPLMCSDGPAAFAADWADAFRRVGRTLGTQARAGTLDRGLRDVLAYHVIFHWNRLGLPPRKQSILAWAARGAILGPFALHVCVGGER